MTTNDATLTHLDLIEEEWGYAFNPAVAMIYGGYLIS